MSTFRFLEFPVYQQMRRLYLQIILIPFDNRFDSLKQQLNRAALSVLLNIAEGSARNTDKEFAYHVRVSLGSLNEVVACIDILKLRRIMEHAEMKNFLDECDLIAKQLGGFLKKLKE